MSRKEKKKYIDDGHTIFNMDVEGLPERRFKQKRSVGLSKKEKNAAIKGAFLAYLPVFAGILISFIVALVLVYLWLL